MASAERTTQLTAPSGNKADLYIYFNETAFDVNTNKSVLYVLGKIKMTSGSFSQISGNTLYIYWHSNVDNQDHLINSMPVSSLSSSWVQLEGWAEYEHNEDGTATGYAYAWWRKTGSSQYVPDTGTSITDTTALTTIPRNSRPTASDGLIGSSITINTNRASNDFTHTITYTCGSESGTIGTNVGESIGWTIPMSIYNQVPSDQPDVQVTISCTTYKNGSQIGTTQTTTMRAGCKTSDCQPDFDFNLVLTDGTATSSLTGANNKIIRGFTTSELQWSATAKYGATISRVYLQNYDNSYTTSPINLYSEEDFNDEALKGGINVRCFDSRGFNTLVTKTYDIIDYFYPTFDYSVRRTSPTGSEVKIEFDGTFFNDTFGSVSNTLSLSWNYKETTSSTWLTGGTLTQNTHYKVNGNSFYSGTGNSKSEITLSSSVFDYTKSYDVRITLTDRIMTYNIDKTITKGIPVYWWKDDQFNFEVNAYIKSKEIATIDLLEPVENNFNYETTETEIGKWTNDKTIYRRIISGTYTSSTQRQTIDLVTGVDTLIKAYGLFSPNNSTPNEMLGVSIGSGGGIDAYSSVRVSSNKIQGLFSTPQSAYSGLTGSYRIVVEYTKQ